MLYLALQNDLFSIDSSGNISCLVKHLSYLTPNLLLILN